MGRHHRTHRRRGRCRRPLQRACVVLRLESWTLERALPKDADEVDDLPRPIYVPLTTAATNINFSDNFEPTPEAVEDPKARTAASASSKRRSKVEPS